MSDLFARYRVTIRFQHRVMGGTPKDPKVIEAWIKPRMGVVEGEQLRVLVNRQLLELVHDLAEGAALDDRDAAIAATVADKSTNGFKRDADLGLYLESRTVKACLKENIN